MRTVKRFTCVVLAVGFLTTFAVAQDDPRLAEILRPLIAAHEGSVTVGVKHLSTGATCFHRGDETMPTASLIKFPVMVAAYQRAEEGKVDLGTQLELKETDKVPGSGVLTTHFSAGMRLSIRDAIRLMIAFSDNTATNLVIDQIGLPYTSELMTAWKYQNTQLHSKVFRGDTSIAPTRSKQYGLGSTTAIEMIRMLEALDRQQLVSADASRQMYEHLLACEDKPRFGLLIPKEVKVAIKTGSVSNARNAAGILETPSGHIALCVMTTNNKDQRWTEDNAAVVLCTEIARTVYDYFNNEASPTAPRELTIGASGDLVQALQRTINKRLPGASLSVDGDFGPATKQGVIAFQRSQNLPPTGVVSQETWKALGPLIQADEEFSIEPDAVNKEVLPLSPADSISGPPLVTANAWAIGHARTGKILWHEKGEDRRDFASTTKTLTAWLVLNEAARELKLLDEVVTISNSADRTPGSTSGLKTGEKISVRELLYGLMLPSGNDAAVALAEFVGPRFVPDKDVPDSTRPVARFVAEMNRTAAKLGLKNTHYANPHGLPDNSHLSSAIDQVKLTAMILENVEFRKYAQTRQHAVRVQGSGGYVRTVVWKNTNKLLEIAGYSGVKTGSTDAAGSCLVSVGEHRGDELIVVVLGCSSNESRYVDTRNLFRWAWQQRGKSD